MGRGLHGYHISDRPDVGIKRISLTHEIHLIGKTHGLSRSIRRTNYIVRSAGQTVALGGRGVVLPGFPEFFRD